MSPRTKSILLLAGVLLLGMLLGALGSGTVFNRRLAKIAELRTSRGMAFVLEKVVRPETEEQRQAFREVIEATAPGYADVFERTGTDLRALNDSVLARVRPLLTEQQTQRLQRYLTMRIEGRLSPRHDRSRSRGQNPTDRRMRRMPVDSVPGREFAEPPSP